MALGTAMEYDLLLGAARRAVLGSTLAHTERAVAHTHDEIRAIGLDHSHYCKRKCIDRVPRALPYDAPRAPC